MRTELGLFYTIGQKNSYGQNITKPGLTCLRHKLMNWQIDKLRGEINYRPAEIV